MTRCTKKVSLPLLSICDPQSPDYVALFSHQQRGFGQETLIHLLLTAGHLDSNALSRQPHIASECRLWFP